MLKRQTAPNWYHTWSPFFVQSLLGNTQNYDEIILLINELCERLTQGDSCIELTDLPKNHEQAIANIQQNEAVYKPLIWDQPYLYLQRFWALENKLAKCLVPLATRSLIPIDLSRFDSLFDDIHQKQALALGVNSPFAMITGGPGTGKTYILTRIVAVLKQAYPEMKIAMAAPTGKAAQRMQESLQKAFSDRQLLDAGLYHADFAHQETLTIHRLLGMGNQQTPKYHVHYPLPYDVVVIDEASMLDLQLAYYLCSAVKPSARLILLGDANQLSSVDVGQVLADLQNVEALKKCHVALQQSRRFSDEANIGRFARYIYQQQAPTFAHWQEQIQPSMIQVDQSQAEIESSIALDWVGFYELPQTLQRAELQQLYACLARGFQGYVAALKRFQAGEINKQQLAEQFDDYRILTAMRHGALGVDQINLAMTQFLCRQLNLIQDQAQEWYLGRPVMMVYNDYQLALSNGDIGICIFDTQQADQYMVYFPSLNSEISVARLPQSIQTAYAMTIHKSQGSEFVHTAVVLDDQASNLLSKELLYTAITRAKKMVSVYSSQQALETSLSVKTKRKSGLARQIEREILTDIK